MTPKKRPRAGSSLPIVAPVPKSQKPPGELLTTEEKRANHIASVRVPHIFPSDGVGAKTQTSDKRGIRSID
jgi:hypothetical protein